MSEPAIPSATSSKLAQSHTMSTSKIILGTVLWLLVLVAGTWVLVARRSGPATGTATATPDALASSDAPAVKASTTTIKINLPSRELPEFEFAECRGGTVTRDSLRGKRWLANFIFTRCAGPCPMMTRDISVLHERISDKNPDFQFVTFTVDPSFDTPDVLKKYAETFKADHERWKFVTGEEQQLYDLIRGGFMQYVKPEALESRVPGFEVAHSNRAVLVNEDSIPVASFVMTIPEDVAKLRRIIEGREEFPKPGPPISVTSDSPENPPVELNILPAKDGE